MMTSVCATLVLATVVALNAAETPTPKPASKEFERMKTLVGTWKGTVDMGQGPVEMVSQYKLVAGGSVLEEKCFAGTPNEMTTMYYDKDGKLALTHYRNGSARASRAVFRAPAEHTRARVLPSRPMRVPLSRRESGSRGTRPSSE